MPPPPELEPLAVDASDPIHRLDMNVAHYFAADHAVGAKFTELRADGTYRSIAREHVGVGEDDAGRWHQIENGEVRLCSAYRYRPIVAGPLWIVVTRREIHDELPDLVRALRHFLATHDGAAFAETEIAYLLSNGRENYQHPNVISDAMGRDVTRAEIATLASAIDRYVASGNENLFRVFAREYRDNVYLDGSWDIPAQTRDAGGLALLHRHFDEKTTTLGPVLAIDRHTFEEAVHKTQPFVVYTAMNDCVGRTYDEVPDDKHERLTPRCRSFDDAPVTSPSAAVAW